MKLRSFESERVRGGKTIDLPDIYMKSRREKLSSKGRHHDGDSRVMKPLLLGKAFLTDEPNTIQPAPARNPYLPQRTDLGLFLQAQRISSPALPVVSGPKIGCGVLLGAF